MSAADVLVFDDSEVLASLQRFQAAVESGALGPKDGNRLLQGATGAWSDVARLLPLAGTTAAEERSPGVLASLSSFYQVLGDALLALPDLGSDPPYWLTLSEACFSAAVHAGAITTNLLEASLSNSTFSVDSKGFLVCFLERISDFYDQLLWYVEEVEWFQCGSSGMLRLHMFRLLFVAFGGDAVSHGLLGADGLLELTGNDINAAVSLVSFALSCDESPYTLQLVAIKCLADFTTADCAFFGTAPHSLADLKGLEKRHSKTNIAKLTRILNKYINALIMALIDYQVVDSFSACYARHHHQHDLIGQFVECFLTTLHNCLLYCSENQKRLRMHLATHADLVPNILIPYAATVLLPKISCDSPEAAAWTSLKSVLQTFVVVTFNIGIFRPHFRASETLPLIVAACAKAGFLTSVNWLEILVKLSVNVDLTLSPWRDDWRHALVNAAHALPSESAALLQRRLSCKGSLGLPMSRSLRAAVAELATIFGEEPDASAIRPHQPSKSSKPHKARRRGKGKGKKGRWVAKKFGLQNAARAAEDYGAAIAKESEDEVDDFESLAAEAKEQVGEHNIIVGSEIEPPESETPNFEAAADASGSHFVCELSGSLMQDPIVTPDGHHYDKVSLQEWVANTGATDPMSGKPLDLAACHEDAYLRHCVQEAQLGAISMEVLESLEADKSSELSLQETCTQEKSAANLGALPSLKMARSIKLERCSREQDTHGVGREQSLEAPARLRCAIDGKLMSNPVQSPYGHTYERRNLQRWIDICGSVCPITSQPLRLADCIEDSKISNDVASFVRRRRRENAAKSGQNRYH